LFAFDEMYGTPILDLPQLLAEGGWSGAPHPWSLKTSRTWARPLLDHAVAQGRRVQRTESVANARLAHEVGDEYDHPQDELFAERARQVAKVRSERTRPRFALEVITGGDPRRPGQELIFTAGGHWHWFQPLRYFPALDLDARAVG
jgi:hypothetical protein